MHLNSLADLCPDLPADVIRLLNARQRYRAVWPAETVVHRSPWHRTCTHRMYNLSCDAFDALHLEAKHACQRCRQSSDRLYIDHDHAIGMWGVRGLLCPYCNALLGRIEAGRAPLDELSATYLADPYPHRQPFTIAPQLSLSQLAIYAYQQEEARAAAAAGWPVHKVAQMGVLRRTNKWKAWREKWRQESGLDVLIALIEFQPTSAEPSTTAPAALPSTRKKDA